MARSAAQTSCCCCDSCAARARRARQAAGQPGSDSAGRTPQGRMQPPGPPMSPPGCTGVAPLTFLPMVARTGLDLGSFSPYRHWVEPSGSHAPSCPGGARAPRPRPPARARAAPGRPGRPRRRRAPRHCMSPCAAGPARGAGDAWAARPRCGEPGRRARCFTRPVFGGQAGWHAAASTAQGTPGSLDCLPVIAAAGASGSVAGESGRPTTQRGRPAAPPSLRPAQPGGMLHTLHPATRRLPRRPRGAHLMDLAQDGWRQQLRLARGRAPAQLCPRGRQRAAVQARVEHRERPGRLRQLLTRVGRHCPAAPAPVSAGPKWERAAALARAGVLRGLPGKLHTSAFAPRAARASACPRCTPGAQAAGGPRRMTASKAARGAGRSRCSARRRRAAHGAGRAARRAPARPKAESHVRASSGPPRQPSAASARSSATASAGSQPDSPAAPAARRSSAGRRAGRCRAAPSARSTSTSWPGASAPSARSRPCARVGFRFRVDCAYSLNHML